MGDQESIVAFRRKLERKPRPSSTFNLLWPRLDSVLPSKRTIPISSGRLVGKNKQESNITWHVEILNWVCPIETFTSFFDFFFFYTGTIFAKTITNWWLIDWALVLWKSDSIVKFKSVKHNVLNSEVLKIVDRSRIFIKIKTIDFKNF